MDQVLEDILEIISDYDLTVARGLTMYRYLEEDDRCDRDTVDLAEGLLIGILLDRAAPFIPDDEQEQQKIMREAEGLPEVLALLPEPIPLIYQVSIGYSVALSETSWKWRPWERVRGKILWPEGEE